MILRAAADIETNVVSVERMKEYTDIESEAPWEVDDNKPCDSWPDKGTIEFRNYSTRYRPGLDLVLSGITVNITGTEKV